MIQTTSPEIGQELEKALKDAGYKTDTYFRQSQNGNTFTYEEFVEFEHDDSMFEEQIPAYIMSELWEMLPNVITHNADHYNKKMEQSPYWATACYVNYNRAISEIAEQESDSPCNALAKLAIWCIENNHKLNLPKNER